MSRTTLDISSPLLIRAKKRAIEMGKPLRALVESALKEFLDSSSARTKPSAKVARKTVRFETVAGGLPSGLDISDRAAVMAWIEKESRDRP